MEKRPCISVSQLFTILFICRMVMSMTYGPMLIGNVEIWDHIVSSVVAFLATFFMVLPIYKLFMSNPKMNLLDNSYDLFGKASFFIILVYLIYYFLVSAHTLSVFESFVSNAVNPPISMPLLAMVLLASACYGAYQGLEALARTSGFIMAGTVLASSLLVVSLLPSIEVINFKPLLYNGFSSAICGFKYMISQSFCLPALVVLLPLAKGNVKRGIFIWNIAIYLFFIMIISLIIGSMGDFASTQLFPVYTASGIGKFGAMRHLDSVYLGVWMSGIFLKLSVFIFLCGECVKKIFGEKMRNYIISFCGAVLGIVSLFPDVMDTFHTEFVTSLMFWYVIIIASVFPLVILILKQRQLGGRIRKIEK